VNNIALHANASALVKNSISNLEHFISPAYRFLKEEPISFLPYDTIIQ
jgi:hypothetical protein